MNNAEREIQLKPQLRATVNPVSDQSCWDKVVLIDAAVPTRSGQRVVIVGEKSLQCTLLNKFLSDTGYHTEIQRELGVASPQPGIRQTLWLIDAGLAEDPRFVKWLDQCRRNALDVMAFIDAVPGSYCEQFIFEPVIKGIFYEGITEMLLLKGISAVFAGECWFPRKLLMLSLEKVRAMTAAVPLALPSAFADRSVLSVKEWRILTHVLRGYSNKHIADRLCLSEHTVKTHLYNIYRKINARNRTQAANWAKQYIQ